MVETSNVLNCLTATAACAATVWFAWNFPNTVLWKLAVSVAEAAING